EGGRNQATGETSCFNRLLSGRPVPAVAARPGTGHGGWRLRPGPGGLAPEPAPSAAVAAPVREAWKRPFDLCVVALAGLPLLPFWILLAAVIALAIRLESPGPALYRQPRLGRGGRAFVMFKFRTMAHGAERDTGPVWAARHDARATRVGRVLRRWRLDELPQVANVVRGEMSIVGPRPERPELAARIEREVPGFAERLRVRPGIAGLAQARGAGHRNPARKLRLDLAYIDAMGPWLDARLIARCVLLVLGRRARAAPRRTGPGPAAPDPGHVTGNPATSDGEPCRT
ncbi:MAG: hypothetical protein F4X97_06590, partial [Boseongicola sp. SB0662_bin_57]|nr:hypothetical protein [Boseongicola sp. SB0662_bin_57]